MMISVRLPHHVASAAAARHRVRETMATRKVGRKLADDVALVMSELVTNAVRHASPLPSGDLEVAWDVGDGIVELRVTDGGGANAPIARPAGPHDATGRGLTIVSKLASAWGVEDAAGATTVWALVATRRRAAPGIMRMT
jgi:anti-sigma regulatory factor (Ser/Thr protein kinase)